MLVKLAVVIVALQIGFQHYYWLTKRLHRHISTPLPHANMVDPPISSNLAHVLPQPLALMSIDENHCITEPNAGQELTCSGQSNLVSLCHLEKLTSRTEAQAVVDNIRDIFWDAFEVQMRSLGRDIGSFQLLDINKGFLMGYFSQISTQINSQAAAAVFKTMISRQKCLEKAYPNTGDVRKLCNLYARVKSNAKKKLDECRKAKRNINTMLEWLN